MPLIFDPKQPELPPEPLGGKAQSLAALAAQNFPIPEWVVVLPSAFDRSLTPEQRQQLNAGIIVLTTLYPNPDVQQALSAAVAQLSPTGEPLAVRSSAQEEDGSQHSYAGQLDSFLSVPPHKVADRVADVWRSNFSERVLAYRRLHSAPPAAAPAVLIQRMVNADCSGVAFSVNPVTGQRGVAVVAAVRGLGSALVSGETNADTYEVDRQGQILAAQPLVANAPVLIDAQVQAIASLARQVEAVFGRPQDIEWAIENGKLYLLQARPITTLGQVADAEGERNLWDNSNIAESYGGITTPLTFSFARSAYEEVYRQFCRLMGVRAAAIAQHDQTFRHMLGLIRGRIYYNLLNWYRVLALLPGFRVNRRFMEQMMGVREELPIEVLAELNAAPSHKLRDRWHLLRSIAGLVGNYLTLPRQIKQFYQRLNQALSLPDAELKAMRPDQLAAHYHNLERQLLTRWDAPLVNDFFAMIFYGVLRKLAVSWCGDRDGTLQNDLISGSGGMISAEPAQRVEQMAALAMQQPSLIPLLCAGSLPEIRAAMPSAFAAEYQAYLERFGDRCLEELKLESSTLHDDPLPLLRAIGRLAQRGRSGTRVTASAEEPRRTATWRVKEALGGNPLRRLVFGWVLRNARRRVRDRENLRFERTRLFGRVRRIFVELGQQFHGLGLLDSPQDIFYLEVPEIFGFIDGTATCTDLRGLAALRRAEFDRYRDLPAPSDRFETRGSVHQGNAFQSEAIAAPVVGDALQGIGCCPGIVRAPVQVIADPKHAELRQGSILVAERTDPGWILLFPAAAGLLVERGSLLSHTAIVSRELGIPAIVALPGLTQWLKDGDWVELNGSTGLVQRIEPPAAPAQTLEAVHE